MTNEAPAKAGALLCTIFVSWIISSIFIKFVVAWYKAIFDQLPQDGWLVLRFWESDIKKNVDGVIAEIMKYLP